MYEGLSNRSEVAHPEKVIVAKARTIKVAKPETVEHLLRDFTRVTRETFDSSKIAVNDLPVFGTKNSESCPEGANERFH
jgi:hypothetical protein